MKCERWAVLRVAPYMTPHLGRTRRRPEPPLIGLPTTRADEVIE